MAPLTILITAGPTIEDIDPVRFISNRATGKLGAAIARAALAAGHKAILIHGPINENVLSMLPKSAKLLTVPVRSASQMHSAVMKHVKKCDAAVMNAAVADFTPVVLAKSKLKKATQSMTLRLKPTVDILKELGRAKAQGNRLALIGFALETGDGRTSARKRASQIAEARRKLSAKNADAIILDSPKEMGAELGDFTLIRRSGGRKEVYFGGMSKESLAVKIVRLCEELASAISSKK